MNRCQINILIACEKSQIECLAFRLQGFNAFSCDLQPTSNFYPEYHIIGDALEILNSPSTFRTQNGSIRHLSKWHLLIAHPPCTYFSRVASRFLFPKGQLDSERYELGLQARDFFMSLYSADVPYIAIENPIPNKIYNLPECTSRFQPYEFGEASKNTSLLWLKNLPPLMPTLFVPRFRQYVKSARGGKLRSKSFGGVAKAMAIQWGTFVNNELNK